MPNADWLTQIQYITLYILYFVTRDLSDVKSVHMYFKKSVRKHRKKVGKDQEKAQSEKDSHSKNRAEKN